MNHVRAIINACLEYTISPFIFSFGVYLVDKIYLIIGTYNIFLNLFSHLFYILSSSRIQEFIDDCMILLPLASLERNQAIILTIFLNELLLHRLENLK